MKLSEYVSRLDLPTSTNVAAVFDPRDGRSFFQLASKFRVELPDEGSDTLAWLQTYDGAARYVVSMLWPPGTDLDPDEIRSQAWEMSQLLADAAGPLSSKLDPSYWITLFSTLQRALTDPMKFTGEQLRSVVTYGYLSAAAGIPYYEGGAMAAAVERGELSLAFANSDYALRLGTCQAICLIARSGVLDSVSASARGSQLGAAQIGIGLAIVIAVAAVAVVLGFFYLVAAMWQTYQHNQTLQNNLQLVCEKVSPERCAEASRRMNQELIKHPPPGPTDVVKQIMNLLFVGGLVAAGVYFLPFIASSVAGAGAAFKRGRA